MGRAKALEERLTVNVLLGSPGKSVLLEALVVNHRDDVVTAQFNELVPALVRVKSWLLTVNGPPDPPAETKPLPGNTTNASGTASVSSMSARPGRPATGGKVVAGHGREFRRAAGTEVVASGDVVEVGSVGCSAADGGQAEGLGNRPGDGCAAIACWFTSAMTPAHSGAAQLVPPTLIVVPAMART